MNKKLIISFVIFIVSLCIMLAFVSFNGLNDYKLTENEHSQIINKQLKNDEKYKHYQLFINKLNYLKYGAEALNNYSKKEKNEILNFNVKNEFDNMDIVEDIEIYELKDNKEKNKVQIYADKEDKAYAIMKSNKAYQHYFRKDSKADKSKEIKNIIEKIENETNLFFFSEAKINSSESKLCFRNLEMNLILNIDTGIIYYPYYEDLSFQSEKLPLQIIYTIKNNKIIKKEVMYLTIDNKPLEEYKLDKNSFLTASDYTNFKSVYINKKSFENTKYTGSFNYETGYVCHSIIINE